MGMATSLKQIDWLKIIGTIAIICLVGIILYGAYSYYFKKPIPVVNNYTAPVTQNTYQIKNKQHLITGIYGNKDTIGISVGWLW
jgi:hypothetical protein